MLDYRVESRLDDQTIWVTWVNFLVVQVDLIHKLNYLDVTWIFNRSHVLSGAEEAILHWSGRISGHF